MKIARLIACRIGNMIGAPAHAAVELQERDDRTGEGDRADGDAERHLDQAGAVDGARRPMPKACGALERGSRHQHRGQTDQRVEGGNQLRHRRHRDAPGDNRADAPPPTARPTRSASPCPIRGRRDHQRGDDRDRHADHAEIVALAGGFGLDRPRSARMNKTPATR